MPIAQHEVRDSHISYTLLQDINILIYFKILKEINMTKYMEYYALFIKCYSRTSLPGAEPGFTVWGTLKIHTI